MEWSTFITSVLVLYGLWYAGNVLKDIIFSKSIAKASESLHYDIEDFLDETPSEVMEPDFIMASEPIGFQEASQQQKAVDTNIAFESPPSGQGIPISEFLKNAKKAAEVSAQKIQFS